MTVMTLLVAIFVGAVIQAVLPAVGGSGLAGAPILPALVVYYALARGGSLLFVAALVGGVLQDALGMTPLGASSFCFCVIGYAVSRYRETVFEHQFITHAFFGALAAGTISVMLAVLLSASGAREFGVGFVLVRSLGAAAAGLLVTPFVFWMMDRLERTLGLVTGEDA